MDDIEYRTRILLSTHRALLGAITNNMRLITIDWNKDFLKLKAYYDKEVTEDDIENLGIIMTEILADFPDINDVEELYEYSIEPINNLKFLREVVFLRKEVTN